MFTFLRRTEAFRALALLPLVLGFAGCSSDNVAPALVEASAPTIEETPTLPVEGDMAWTTASGPEGFHLLVAKSSEDYAFHTVATLSEPGFDTDAWIGNVCLTESGQRAIVVYAPRQFTNREEYFQRGAFAAIVDLSTGAVEKLGLGVSLAYHNPGCGAGELAVLNQSGGQQLGKTRLHLLDATTGKIVAQHELEGQVTSAIPALGGIVAAGHAGLIHLDARGRETTLATTRGAPFALRADADGGIVYLEAPDDSTGVVKYLRGTQVSELAHGPLQELRLARGSAGNVFITGNPAEVRELPRSVRRIRAAADADISTLGRVALSRRQTRSLPPQLAATKPRLTATPIAEEVLSRPVPLTVAMLDANREFEVDVTPGAGIDGRAPLGRTPVSPRLASAVSSPSGVAKKTQALAEDSDTTDPQRTCAVPRNDPGTQVYQPHWRQVEWAVDMAIQGQLNITRPANWHQSGLRSWSPQVEFPRGGLSTGGRIPAQILLGVLAQESNLWQASRDTVEGVYGNPLVGDFYGLRPGGEGNWIIDFDKADCGYGIGQITDGMRRDDGYLDSFQERALAVDYASNIAMAVHMLEEKWNQTQALGIRINDNDPARIENWFAAVWAYNTGLQPNSANGNTSGCKPGPDCTDAPENGRYGLGWANNPANPDYPAYRTPFGKYASDAITPQMWPYPEKIMGWAAYPIIKGYPTDPDHYEAGYRQAWWNSDIYRDQVKPPRALFCNEKNDCDITLARPCKRDDLHCWWHEPAVWKPDCSTTEGLGLPVDTCGYEGVRYDPPYAEPPDWNAWYPANCRGDAGQDAPAGSYVIDDLPDDATNPRPCTGPTPDYGRFKFNFSSDAFNRYRSKIDLHQVGGGYDGHFWFSRTRSPEKLGADLDGFLIQGAWELNFPLDAWARVLVHIPDHRSHTQQATYTVYRGDGSEAKRIINAKSTGVHRWVSLGVFRFRGVPKVVLTNASQDGSGDHNIVWDAIAIQPLPAKPADLVVALGDSFSSGEGAGVNDPATDYYRETDLHGSDPLNQNACHRSRLSWPRKAILKTDLDLSIGTREDNFDNRLDYHMVACSGARTFNILPWGTQNAEDKSSEGQFHEVPQLEAGFLDDNTTLVTISIGGNDAKFADVITQCMGPKSILKDCQDTTLDGSDKPLRDYIPQHIDEHVAPSIFQTLTLIHERAPNAKIVLMGYPQLISNDGSCLRVYKTKLGLSAGEAAWLNEVSDYLAASMKRTAEVARQDGIPAWFADPYRRFLGTAVCGEPQTINAIVPKLTPGEKGAAIPTPWGRLGISQQSFHPNDDGTTNYAFTLIDKLRSPEIDL